MPRPNPRAVLARPLTTETLVSVSEACVALGVPEAQVPTYRAWLASIVRQVGPARLERVRWGDVVELSAQEVRAPARALEGWTPGAGLRPQR